LLHRERHHGKAAGKPLGVHALRFGAPERILLEGDEFVFVSSDKFAEGDSDGVTQASASKPLIGMANDPFRQGAFEEVGLVNALSLQPTNLVRRELGMNPRINLVRFVITARCQAIWIHRWAGYGRGGAGTNLPFLLSESFGLVFQKYLSENAKSLLLAFSTVVSKATPAMKKSGLARNLGKLSSQRFHPPAGTVASRCRFNDLTGKPTA
jgi:hypothetical protein